MGLREMYTRSDSIQFATNLLKDVEHFCDQIILVTIHRLSNNIPQTPEVVHFGAPREQSDELHTQHCDHKRIITRITRKAHEPRLVGHCTMYLEFLTRQAAYF